MASSPSDAQSRDVAAVRSAFDELRSAEITEIGGGLLHRTYAVTSPPGAYVLQRVNPVFSLSIHDNIERVTRHLELRGMRTLRLVPASTGELCKDLGDHGRWRLLTRLPGQSHAHCDRPERARSAGELIARFHGALADFDSELHPLGFPFHDTERHLSDLVAALDEHPNHRHHVAVRELASRIERATRAWTSFERLPLRVVHGDLKFSNVLFEAGAESTTETRATPEGATDASRPRENGSDRSPQPPERASSLVDLDTLSRHRLHVDLGDAWRSWCNRRVEDETLAELDLSLFRASAEGYLSTCDLDLGRDELASLAEGIERMSLELAARFAADVLRESYFGWNREKFESAGDHNLARAVGQMSLHDQALETRQERLRFLLG